MQPVNQVIDRRDHRFDRAAETVNVLELAMSVVLVGVLPTVLFFWGRPAMLALGDAAVFTKITTVAIVAQFVILLALVGQYGATGAALGFAAMNLVSVVLTVGYLHRRGVV